MNPKYSTSLSGGLIMLTKVSSKLPPSERKLAEYILKYPHDAIQLTAKELGERSLASGAAVMRLCKSLGLQGFPELKIRIAGDLQQQHEIKYQDITAHESLTSVVEKMTSNSLRAIQETREIMNYSSLERAVHAMKEAGTIHFFGVGASGIIAQDAQQKFIRIRKTASAFTDIHAAAMMIANARANDVVFGISFSGETQEVAKLLELGRQQGAITVSLTRFGSSIVAQKADIHLFVSSSEEKTFRSGATSSRIAQMHIIDILFMSMVTDEYDDTVQHLQSTRDAVRFMSDGN